MSFVCGMAWPLIGIVYGTQTNTFMDAQVAYDAGHFLPTADNGLTTVLNGSNLHSATNGNYSTPDIFLDGVIQAAVRYSIIGVAVFFSGYLEVLVND